MGAGPSASAFPQTMHFPLPAALFPLWAQCLVALCLLGPQVAGFQAVALGRVQGGVGGDMSPCSPCKDRDGFRQ